MLQYFLNKANFSNHNYVNSIHTDVSVALGCLLQELAFLCSPGGAANRLSVLNSVSSPSSLFIVGLLFIIQIASLIHRTHLSGFQSSILAVHDKVMAVRGQLFAINVCLVVRGRNSGSPVVRGLPETWSDFQR